MRSCKIHSLWFVLLGLALLLSCKTISIHVPKGYHKVEASGTFKAGIGRVLLTVPPGHSMGGYGNELGKISRGWWNHLYTTAFYLEDAEGEVLVLVSVDLWSISAGLTDKVMYYLHRKTPEKYRIGRESLIFAATHTHNSPGNVSSSWGYNLGSSALVGFDKQLFDVMAKRIALSIQRAIDDARPAYLEINQTTVAGLSRNRSLPPFQNNPPDQVSDIIARVSDPGQYFEDTIKCYAQNVMVFQAIDPTLTTMAVYDQGSSQLRGVVAAFGLHPTVMGSDNPLLSSDVYGVARLHVENYYKERGKDIVNAFINGAEGDVSANWYNQDRENAMRIGTALARETIESVGSGLVSPVTPSIRASLNYPRIADRSVVDVYNELSCIGAGEYKTDIGPVVGRASLNGAEDGRTNGLTRSEECGYDEGVVKACFGPQATKRELKISRLAGKASPRYLPMGHYTIGPLTLVTMPGETTVALAERLKKAAGSNPDSTVVLSLANEYISYLTTPSEYMLQHYEGSFTVYGAGTGLFLEQEIRAMQPGESPQWIDEYGGNKRKKYIVGLKLKKDRALDKMVGHTWLPEDNLNGPYNLKDTRQRNFTCGGRGQTRLPGIKDRQGDATVPGVEVRVMANGQWEILEVVNDQLGQGRAYAELQTDRQSSNFLVYMKNGDDGILRWESLWMVPPGYQSDVTHKMILTYSDGARYECLIERDEF